MLKNLTEENINKKLLDIDGILVPGGFGERATKGKIIAIKYARTNNIPFFWNMFRYATCDDRNSSEFNRY